MKADRAGLNETNARSTKLTDSFDITKAGKSTVENDETRETGDDLYLGNRSERTCDNAIRQTESDEPLLLESGFATNNG